MRRIVKPRHVRPFIACASALLIDKLCVKATSHHFVISIVEGAYLTFIWRRVQLGARRNCGIDIIVI
jgi:hypothetical protein